jgi:hypothetical protein
MCHLFRLLPMSRANSAWRVRVPGLSGVCLHAHELKIRVTWGVPHSLLAAECSLLTRLLANTEHLREHLVSET